MIIETVFERFYESVLVHVKSQFWETQGLNQLPLKKFYVSLSLLSVNFTGHFFIKSYYVLCHKDELYLLYVYISDGIRLPAPPLDSKCLEDARLVRKRELMMKSAFKNVVINLFVCWLLFSISYSNRDNRSYYLHDDVVTQILKPAEFPKFMDVSF